MSAGWLVLRAALRDGLRSRIVYGFGLFFLAAGWMMARLGGNADKVLLSLLSLSLALVPLVSLVFGASYLYQARTFIELLLAQPVKRRTLFLGLYTGLSLPLALAWLLGCLPALLMSGGVRPAALLLFLGAGVGLCVVFCALAFLIAVRIGNRLRGLGLAIVLWLLLAVAWDGLVLMLAYLFSDWPMEGPVLVLCLLNPIDLARVLVLLHFELGAMMGYTGAVFQQFFSGPLGTALASLSLLLWVLVPLWLAGRAFQKRDF
ncbi:MAG: ABC transporter permease subunit [Calditrichaeota bacterium]|nr:ABC transporter permease subunit [Calditrichota bacterium]